MRAQGRPAQLDGDQLFIGGKRERVAIMVASCGGRPKVHARASSNDAIGHVLGMLVDLDIRIPERRAAFDDIRRALGHAPIDTTIPVPAGHEQRSCGDAFECAGDAGDCFDLVDVASSCDLPCPDPGCF
ncbi:MAG TPA: hypothetical protein VIV11_40250 [Kofleriaceae bacterium]